MLILPPGHAERTPQRRPLSARERWLIRGVLSLVAALAVVLVISLTSGERQSAHGCIDVGLPYSTGGAKVFRCGSGARALCSEAGSRGGLTGAAAHAVATQCRKAGLPVG